MRRKIKIVEFISRIEFGGVESVVLNYIDHMPDKKLFEFYIISQNIYDPNCVKLFESKGVHVYFVTHKRTSLIKNCREILTILKKEKFDVAHSHMTLTNFYVLFMAKLTGTKIRISHSHNAFEISSWKQKVYWPFLKWLNKKSSNVWAACGYDAGRFLYGYKAMESGRVFIMNNAIDVQRFQYNQCVRDEIRRKLELSDSFVVGHVGRFMEQKNHFFLIDIFAEVLKLIPEAKLLLIGDGELREAVVQKVDGLGLENSVVFTGNVVNPNEYYQAMDIFVLPSLFEGLPVVSIEAQASGLPCFISDKVDNRCRLTSNIKFLPIDEGPRLWADSISNCRSVIRNQHANEEIESQGYNIVKEAENLSKIYLGEKFKDKRDC